MAGNRKASGDAPGTSRPPSPRTETVSDDEELSPSAYLFSGDSGSDGEQSTRVMAPPPPSPRDPRAMNVMDANLMFLLRQERELSVNLRGRAARDYARVADSGSDGEKSTRVMAPPPPPRDPRARNVMDANLMFLQRQERELSVNLRGRAARDYARGLSDGGSAAGEENEVSSPCRFVALSELTVPQPPSADQPAAAAAKADHSVPEAAPAPARCYASGSSDAGSAAREEKELSSPWKFVRLSDLIGPQPPAADQSAAVRAETCRACRRWKAVTPWVPYRHVCLCVPCRHSTSARISCWVCGAGRRRSSTGRP